MFEIQISKYGTEWYSIRNENNDIVYLYESEEEALKMIEKLENQYTEYKLKIIQL